MNNPLPIDASQINISVQTNYIAAQSEPENERFVFSYTITITNNGCESVKLLARRWQITDANGEKNIVEGKGVIGQTPEIAASASYTYSSGSMFSTPVGTMEGHYQMVSSAGELLKVPIPIFRLAIPNILN